MVDEYVTSLSLEKGRSLLSAVYNAVESVVGKDNFHDPAFGLSVGGRHACRDMAMIDRLLTCLSVHAQDLHDRARAVGLGVCRQQPATA